MDRLAEKHSYLAVSQTENGDALYTISKSDHDELMRYIRQQLDSIISEIECSEYAAGILSIRPSEDYTSYIIEISPEGIGTPIPFSTAYVLNYLSFSYCIFNGTPVSNIHIQYINSITNATVIELDTADL